MLSLTKTQLEALHDAQKQVLYEKLYRAFEPEFESLVVDEAKHEPYAMRFNFAWEQAESYSIITEINRIKLIQLLLPIGSQFDVSSQYTWMRKILASNAPEPDKVAHLYQVIKVNS